MERQIPPTGPTTDHTTAVPGIVIDPAASYAFAGRLRGELVVPDSAAYDEARAVWNGMIDKRPALVARCTDTADVVAAVDFARDHGLLLALRGGSHNVAGHATCDGGLVADLSPMNGVRVDPEASTVRVDGGALWSDVDAATAPHGLAVPAGLVSATGVAGLILGGGFGWLARRYGLTCDHLLSAEVVTADGAVLTASEDEHPDLFWALRGGGGNFGAVTEFEFRARRVPEVTAGLVIHRLEDAAEVIREYRRVVYEAADSLTCYLLFRPAPPAPFVPQELHGRPILALVLCALGEPEEAEALARPLRDIGDPVADIVTRRPYSAWQSFSDANWQPGWRDYWKADYMSSLPDEAVDILVAHAAELPTTVSDFKVAHFEGAIARVPTDATAFPHRDAPHVFALNTRWKDPAQDAEMIAWSRSFHAAMKPFGTGGVYVNFVGDDEGEDRVHQSFGPNYPRLAQIKAAYDPKNLFRVNQNIRPSI